MKTIDKPTFKSDSGKLFTNAGDAADEDVRAWFTEMFCGNSDTFSVYHIAELTRHWKTLRRRLNQVHEDLEKAHAFTMLAESQTLELDDAEREALEGVR